MCKMFNVIEVLKNNHSAFRHMAICAMLIGVGDVLCAVFDLIWLFGDMSIQIHSHHYIVMIGLIIANILIDISFIWLIKSIWEYVNTHDRKVSAKKNDKKQIVTHTKLLDQLIKRIEDLERDRMI